MQNNETLRTPHFDVPASRIVDLFINAIEGGSSYWAKSVHPLTEGEDYEELVQGFVVTEREGNKVYVVTRDEIEKAIILMSEKYPKHFDDVVFRNDDALTADVFFQLCVFQDVIYA